MKTYTRVFAFTCTFALILFWNGNRSIAAEEEISLRVARLSHFEGAASIQRMQDEDWIDAMVNVPLMAGDKLYTAPGSRAEIQLEDNVSLYLGDDTFIIIQTLDDALGRIEIIRGTLAVNAQGVDFSRPPLEIKSTYFLATVLEQVKARFNVAEAGPAEIPVRRGTLRIYRDGESHYRINRDEKLLVNDPDPMTYLYVGYNTVDDFDRWCDLRDAMNYTSPSKRYVSTRISGYSDLDRYGEWIEAPDYGRVWRPTTVVADWAPYRHGRWVWVEPYSWTWVSYEPWGWAPYHYGRWVYTPRYRWCWAPTDVVYVSYHPRPVWYPALVSFSYARHGRHFGLSIGGGFYDDPCIGWFPLGPRDHFHPWYHHRSLYVHAGTHKRKYHDRPDTVINNITINNTTINNYQNSNAPNAVTVMPQRDFVEGRHERRQPATLAQVNSKEVQVGSTAVTSLPQRRERVDANRREEVNVPTASATLNAGGKTTPASPAKVDAARTGVSPERNQISKPETAAKASVAPSVSREAPRTQAVKPQREAAADGWAKPYTDSQTLNNAPRSPKADAGYSDTRSKAEPAKAAEPRGSNSTSVRPDTTSARRAPEGIGSAAPKTAADSAQKTPRIETNKSSLTTPTTSRSTVRPDGMVDTKERSVQTPQKVEAARPTTPTGSKTGSSPARITPQTKDARVNTPSTPATRQAPVRPTDVKSSKRDTSGTSKSQPSNISPTRSTVIPSANSMSGTMQSSANTNSKVYQSPDYSSSRTTPQTQISPQPYQRSSVSPQTKGTTPRSSETSSYVIPKSSSSTNAYRNGMNTARAQSGNTYAPSRTLPGYQSPSYSLPSSSYSGNRSTNNSYSSPSQYIPPSRSSSFSAPSYTAPSSTRQSSSYSSSQSSSMMGQPSSSYSAPRSYSPPSSSGSSAGYSGSMSRSSSSVRSSVGSSAGTRGGAYSSRRN
ncbi:MAG: hypothetical protein C4527_02675 [Candidatus Omnitrophota bacterium]|jgi:hypothetical protein|nr:MAG: hypothetical protein C4527_02675 [Candidatus Omnitrophota bacterium]